MFIVYSSTEDTLITTCQKEAEALAVWFPDGDEPPSDSEYVDHCETCKDDTAEDCAKCEHSSRNPKRYRNDYDRVEMSDHGVVISASWSDDNVDIT